MSEWDLPESVESTSIEKVGGGYSWESAVYDAVVQMAYLIQAKSGAIGFSLILKNTSGKELKETFWIKSGNDKGNKSFYTDKRDNKDYPIPGYSVVNSLCVAALGQSLSKTMQNIEKRTIKVYDAAEGKDINKECPIVVDLTEKIIKVAVHQIKENKRKKNDATGKYEDLADTRMINECKFFGNAEGKTAEEITKNEPAEMFTKWAEKNTGQVIDKSKKVDGKQSAAAIMGDTAATPTAKSLF
jgi:ribosomal 50S subunit-recycling heat shock protein